MAGEERIDRFEVEVVLGAGAFATVWLARDPVLDLRVAIKVLADNWSRDPAIRARFIEEARVLWQADSARIVRVHHVGELPDGRPYFVMGWADRGTLRERMTARFQSGSVFTVDETASIVAELCRAVRDVHGLGRIHRDIKPANVLLRTTASRTMRSIHGLAPDEQVVLADFGLAREIDASALTLVSGSPAYVAPEQAQGNVQLDERADIYPLGLIMVELLSGRSPAERATMLDAATTPVLDVAGHLARAGVRLPPRMQELAEQMVAPDPAHRLHSADAIARELAEFVTQQPAHSHQSTTPSPEPRWNAPQAAPATPAPATPGPGSTAPASTALGGGSDTGAGPVSDRSHSRLGLVVGAVLVVAVIAAGAGFVLTRGGSGTDDDVASSSSTVATTATESTVTTSAPSTSTDASGGAGTEPVAVPVPERSVTASAEEDRVIENVASPIAEVTEFYQTLDDPSWRVDAIDPVGDTVEIAMTGPTRTARVLLEPAAVSAGDNITRIQIDYSER